MHTYPHDVRDSQRRRQIYRDVATSLYESYTDEWYVEQVMLRLQHVAEHGLPDCYSITEHFMHDVFADLPFATERQINCIKLALGDVRWRNTARQVLIKVSLDLTSAFEFALKELSRC